MTCASSTSFVTRLRLWAGEADGDGGLVGTLEQLGVAAWSGCASATLLIAR